MRNSMAFLEIGIAGILFGLGYRSAKKEAEKRQREEKERCKRRSCVCRFNDGVSRADFEKMIKKSTKNIGRIKDIAINGPYIKGVVESQSGISTWEFEIDFNDYGHLTGNYWIRSENDDSAIPERIAVLVKNAIQHQNYEGYSWENSEGKKNVERKLIECPECNMKILVDGACFCAYCGTHFYS